MSRPTRYQANLAARHQHHAHNIVDTVQKRLTDNVINELVRRHLVTTANDGWGTGTPDSPSTRNAQDIRPTEQAALANITRTDDPAGELIATVLANLTEAAGLMAGVNRALDELQRGVGTTPGEFEPECRNCGDKASRHPDKPGWRLRLERCPACYTYWDRHGEERPKGRKAG